MAQRNICFVVCKHDLSAEDMLIGLPVLHLLRVDTRTNLDRSGHNLDDFYCFKITGSGAGCCYKRLIDLQAEPSAKHFEKHHSAAKEDEHDQLFGAFKEVDPFPDV